MRFDNWDEWSFENHSRLMDSLDEFDERCARVSRYISFKNSCERSGIDYI